MCSKFAHRLLAPVLRVIRYKSEVNGLLLELCSQEYSIFFLQKICTGVGVGGGWEVIASCVNSLKWLTFPISLNMGGRMGECDIMYHLLIAQYV